MKIYVYYMFVGLFFNLSTIPMYAQTPAEMLIIQANENATAMLEGDYEKLVHFMDPVLVDYYGGFQSCLANVEALMTQMEAAGTTYEHITVGQPSIIVKEGQDDVAIVPTEMIMRVGNKRVIVNSYLVAVTMNLGDNWYFFDGAQMPEQMLSQIFPNLVASVKIPERKNTMIDEINETLRRVERKEGKPIEQVLAEALAESRQVTKKIEDNNLRVYIEKREGKKLDQIATVRLKEILKELNIK